MQPHDREQFAVLITEVMGYYQRDCTSFLIGIYWDGLQRFEFDDVRRAFSVHAQDPDRGQFAPRIADITRLLEGSTSSQGMRAWAMVERALRSVGSYQSVVFDDPLIHAVISDMGGWTRLCQTPTDELPFRMRDFERSYAAFKHRREIPPYPARLIGIAEAENAMQGYEIPRPVLIGDPDRAMRVLEKGGGDSPLRITQSGAIASELVARIGNRRDVA